MPRNCLDTITRPPGRSRAVLGCLLALVVRFMLPSPAFAQESDRHAVLALVQGFFDAMAASDTVAARRILLEDGQFVSVREGDGGPSVRVSSHRDWIDQLPDRGTKVLERMWEPTVLINDRVAVVWTPYDFHIDGRFSHCGTDVFNFLKGESGSIMTGATWTVEREDCDPSPLGPLAARGLNGDAHETMPLAVRFSEVCFGGRHAAASTHDPAHDGVHRLDAPGVGADERL